MGLPHLWLIILDFLSRICPRIDQRSQPIMKHCRHFHNDADMDIFATSALVGKVCYCPEMKTKLLWCRFVWLSRGLCTFTINMTCLVECEKSEVLKLNLSKKQQMLFHHTYCICYWLSTDDGGSIKQGCTAFWFLMWFFEESHWSVTELQILYSLHTEK